MPQSRAVATPDRMLPAAGTLSLADVGQLALRLHQAGQADAAVALYRQWIAGGPLPMRHGAAASLTGAPGSMANPAADDSQVIFPQAVRRAVDAARPNAAR